MSRGGGREGGEAEGGGRIGEEEEKQKNKKEKKKYTRGVARKAELYHDKEKTENLIL
jgi:hypothetical protein